MPEGPEIRRAADRIERAVGGRAATRVQFAFPHLKKFERTLRGKRVESVETRGKAMLIHFENDRVVYTHSQLYGRWYVRPAGELPRTNRSLRFAIHNGEHSALLYSASEIDVLRPAEIPEHSFLGKLGPDVLDPRLTLPKLRARLADPRFARRALPALLLDQSFVAGIGNYLRSEMLYVAGVHPDQRLGDLSAEEQKSLARAIRDVAQRAYKTGGVTNDAKRVTALRKQKVRRRDYRHHVFTRGGRPCWTCGAKVVRTELGGRKLFYCPACQPARSAPDAKSARASGKASRKRAASPRSGRVARPRGGARVAAGDARSPT